MVSLEDLFKEKEKLELERAKMQKEVEDEERFWCTEVAYQEQQGMLDIAQITLKIERLKTHLAFLPKAGEYVQQVFDFADKEPLGPDEVPF